MFRFEKKWKKYSKMFLFFFRIEKSGREIKSSTNHRITRDRRKVPIVLIRRGGNNGRKNMEYD